MTPFHDWYVMAPWAQKKTWPKARPLSVNVPDGTVIVLTMGGVEIYKQSAS